MRKFTKAIVIILALGIIRIISRTEIEKGICLNKYGDGQLYNGEPFYNYISYSGTDAKPGDEVITIDVLNPLNNYCDDIIFRYDIVK